jgi:NAD(P)-dependent dehydrogenase (short-subunit alcohol dehydrogenase family)
MATPPLKGRVAVVAGATRGAGRGIARMLGEAGATVYCTGRSTRASAPPSPRQASGRSETIEETAELVTAAGGVGIPVRVDHTQDDEVAALFQRVAQDHQRVDVLANVITGDPASWKEFLEETPSEGRTFVDTWVWPHISTAWHAAKIMSAHQSGLLVELVEQNGIDYHGAFYFDLMEIVLKRHIFALAHNLGQRGITAVAVEPGFMRTEAILEKFGVTEANWHDGLQQGKAWGWGGSESPCFVGRAVAALAADGGVARWNGRICTAWDLSAHYGFTDIDGSLPDRQVLVAAQAEAKKTFLAPMFAATQSVPVEWRVAPRGRE